MAREKAAPNTFEPGSTNARAVRHPESEQLPQRNAKEAAGAEEPATEGKAPRAAKPKAAPKKKR